MPDTPAEELRTKPAASAMDCAEEAAAAFAPGNAADEGAATEPSAPEAAAAATNEEPPAAADELEGDEALAAGGGEDAESYKETLNTVFNVAESVLSVAPIPKAKAAAGVIIAARKIVPIAHDNIDAIAAAAPAAKTLAGKGVSAAKVVAQKAPAGAKRGAGVVFGAVKNLTDAFGEAATNAVNEARRTTTPKLAEKASVPEANAASSDAPASAPTPAPAKKRRIRVRVKRPAKPYTQLPRT